MLPVDPHDPSAMLLYPEARGFPSCSRWLRSVATTPPENDAPINFCIPAGMPASRCRSTHLKTSKKFPSEVAKKRKSEKKRKKRKFFLRDPKFL
jgi:hypothetical protein